MVEANRTDSAILRLKKPRLILDGNFPIIESLEVGDKGQMKARVEITGIELIPDSNSNEIKRYIMEIRKAELIDAKQNI